MRVFCASDGEGGFGMESLAWKLHMYADIKGRLLDRDFSGGWRNHSDLTSRSETQGFDYSRVYSSHASASINKRLTKMRRRNRQTSGL